MTIKPATKRAPPDTDGKIENPNGGTTGDPTSNHGQQNVVVGRSGVVVLDSHGQSPQRRELYEDLTRHRCSPNKSGRNKRRDHLHDTHHKRERNERVESHKHVGATGSASVVATRAMTAGGLSLNSNMNVTGVAGVAGRNSPAINDITVANANLLAATTVGVVNSNSPVNLANVSVGSVSPARDYLVSGNVGPSSSSTNVVVGGGVGGVSGGGGVGCVTSGSLLQATGTKLLKSIEESCSGYNSGDEHMAPKEKTVTAAEWKRRDEQFVCVMSEAGFEVRQVEEDGACLFRSISLQIYGDEDAHDIVRQHTMDYIYKNREYFSQFVTEDIDSYITRKRRKDSHGNHIEIQAMSEIYARPVEVYCYKSKPINIFNSEQQRNGYAPLRLSYQRSSHYNAIIDPYNATVGVGLGIANYRPTMQTQEAMLLSEQLEIEQTMFEDKLKTTDWEATNEVIEEQVARESYLQWCRENLQKSRAAEARSATATITSAQALSNDDIVSSLDEIASPSKYVINNSGNSSSSSNNNSGNNSSHSSPISLLNLNKNNNNENATNEIGSPNTVALMSSTTRKLNFLCEKQNSNNNVNGGIENSSSIGNLRAGSPAGSTAAAKKLNVLTKLQKDAGNYDSDDTDISTSSSLADGINGGGAESPNHSTSTALRSKKMKTRYNSKKRRHEQLLRHNDNNEVGNVHVRLSGAGNGNGGIGNGGNSSVDGSNNSGSSSDATPRVYKGAKRDNLTIDSSMNYIKTIDNEDSKIEERPCSSKCAQQTIGGTNMDTNTNAAPFSSFYQDLLESSYTADGYGQLTEAEMLQRAIQMSTQDFIEDQKRKYLYRP